MNLKKPADSQSYKIRDLRPKPMSDHDVTSDIDGKSFYSEVRQKVHFRFENKQQDYVDDDEPLEQIKPGFISNLRNASQEKNPSSRGEQWSRQKQLSEYISTKKSPEEIYNYRTSIQKRGVRVGGEHIDYDTLYKHIRLPSMKEERQKEDQQTIEHQNDKSNETASQLWHQQNRFVVTTPLKPNSHKSRVQESFVHEGYAYESVNERQYELKRSRQSAMVDQEIQTNVQWQPQTFEKLQLPKIKTEEIEPENSLVKSRHVDDNLEPTKPDVERLRESRRNPVKLQSIDQDEEQNLLKSRQMQAQQAQLIVEPTNIPEEQQSNLFDLSVYLQLYHPLQAVLQNLRNSDLLKSVKAYLEVMATGRIDSFDFVRLPLHKKKIIKMSLLYERLSVIIVSFAYATDKLAECHRYLANLIRFSLSNYLICLKVISAGCVKQSSPLYQQHQDIWLLSAKEYQTKGLETLRDNNEILADTINKLAREDEIFFDSLKKFIKNSGKFTLQQNFYYILEYFALFLNLCELDHRIPFLAVAPNPYLPPTTTPEKYTLVIDLLQVMCHPKKTESFRPYSQYFFDEMSQYYEIVVFSAAYPNHLNKVIDIVDRKKRVQHRLYRHHTIRSLGAFVKDVSRLGRQPDRIILLDTNNQSDRLSKDNTIPVKPWTGGSKDTLLAQLCPMLAMIVIKNMDARQAAMKYRDQMAKNISSGVKYVNFGMNLE